MNSKKYISALTAICVLIACAAGCQPSQTPSTSDIASEPSASEPASSPAESSDEESVEASEEEDTSIPDIVDPTPDSEGEYIDGLFLYNGTAYELFYGDEDMAKNYAETMSYVKKGLGDKIKVYNVLVPTHVGVDLPDKFKDICNPQDTYIQTIIDSYDADIIGVNAYNDILRHRDQYIYFNTDHHWTGLGAYYAYKALSKKAGFDPIKLEDMKEETINGYYGSLSWNIPEEKLKEDHVTYYTVDYDINCTLYDNDGQNPQEYSLIHSYAEGSNAYGVFLGGDTPLVVAKNSKGNGKKIAVVKESYGNAFSPFIAYTYSETHFIDFRYVNFDLKSYLEKNGIEEVVFINNTMASATSVRCEEMRDLVKSDQTYAGEDEAGDDINETGSINTGNIEDYL